jgi:hypothetical protein
MRNFSIASVALAVAFAAGLAPAQNPAPQSPAPAPAAQASTPASNPAATTAAEPAVQTSPTTKPAAKPAGDGKRFKTVDKMELDATAVTGNRELPKVLYIVPWKKADLGDLVGKPMNSLVDEVLAPVDRDVFKRQLRYYGALQPDKAASGAATEAQPEK